MDKYLIELLKEENTVIIPELGALMASGTNNTNIMFNAYLKFDDGVLAKYVAEKENADLTETKNKIASHVRDIKAQLDKGETYAIFGLGKFSKNSEGEIEFEQSSESVPEDSSPAQTSSETPKADTGKNETDKPESKEEQKKKESSSAPSPEDKKEKTPPKSSIKPKEESKKTSVSEAQKKNTFNEKNDPDDQKKETTDASGSKEEKDPLKHVAPQKTPQEKGAPKKNDTKGQKKTSKKPAKPSKKKPPKTKAKKEKKGNGKLILIIILVVILGGGGTFVGLQWDWVSKQLGIAKAEASDTKENDKKSSKESQGEDETPQTEDHTVAHSDTSGVADTASNIQDTASVEATPGENSTTATQESTSQETSENSVQQNTNTQSTSSGSTSGQYYIIVNSFSVLDNANNQVSKLKSEGYSASIAGQTGSLHLVSAGAYNSKQEAQSNLNKIRNAVEPNAWIYSK